MIFHLFFFFFDAQENKNNIYFCHCIHEWKKKSKQIYKWLLSGTMAVHFCFYLMVLIVRFAIRLELKWNILHTQPNELVKWAIDTTLMHISFCKRNRNYIFIYYSMVTIECMRTARFNCFSKNARQNFAIHRNESVKLRIKTNLITFAMVKMLELMILFFISIVITILLLFAIQLWNSHRFKFDLFPIVVCALRFL